MLRSIIGRLAIAAVTIGIATSVSAAPCKDAKGKFTKCPPAATKTVKRCRNAKGHFVKCGTPGAKPA